MEAGLTRGSDRPVAALLRTLAASVEGNLGDAILRGALAPTTAACVLIHAAQDGSLQLVAHAGVPLASARHYSVIPIAMHLPMTEAFLAGTELTIDAQTWASNYPLGALLARELHGTHPALEVRVLRRGGIAIGTLTIGFTSLPAETRARHDLLDALTDALALWCSGARAPVSPSLSVPSETITARQREVLALVSEGLTNPQIAERLDVSVATIKAEISWLFTLLGAKRRSQLPARAIRAGL